MNQQTNIVDMASDNSFPASDPPSFTPVTGSVDPHVARQVVDLGERKVIYVEAGGGEALRHYLASHGISANILPRADHLDRVEVDNDVSAENIQTILDEWGH